MQKQVESKTFRYRDRFFLFAQHCQYVPNHVKCTLTDTHQPTVSRYYTTSSMAEAEESLPDVIDKFTSGSVRSVGSATV